MPATRFGARGLMRIGAASTSGVAGGTIAWTGAVSIVVVVVRLVCCAVEVLVTTGSGAVVWPPFPLPVLSALDSVLFEFWLVSDGVNDVKTFAQVLPSAPTMA